MAEWLGTHKRMGYTSCKDDLMAYSVYILILFGQYLCALRSWDTMQDQFLTYRNSTLKDMLNSCSFNGPFKIMKNSIAAVRKHWNIQTMIQTYKHANSTNAHMHTNTQTCCISSANVCRKVLCNIQISACVCTCSPHCHGHGSTIDKDETMVGNFRQIIPRNRRNRRNCGTEKTLGIPFRTILRKRKMCQKRCHLRYEKINSLSYLTVS